MKPFDIDDEFEAFMRKCAPEVPETSVQYKESRRVFSAGAAVMFLYITRELPLFSDESGVEELQKLQAQFDEMFYKRIGWTD